jgi:CYTH domain-containing protein
MAAGLVAIAALSRDESFRERVRAAVLVAARDIGTESGGSEYHEKRRELAAGVAFDVDVYLPGFAGLVACNSEVTAASSDNDVQFTVNSVWNAVAGAGAAPSTSRVAGS